MRFFDEPLATQDLESFAAQFDHNLPAFGKNPFEIYRTLRSRCPVMHSEAQNGFWIPTAYTDIAAIARDDVNFSSKQVTIPQHPETCLPPITFDPPQSTEYRNMISALLAPAAIKRLETVVRSIAAELVGAFVGRGTADLVQDLAKPLTTRTTITLTGLPEELGERIMYFVTGGILGTITPEEYAEGLVWVHQVVSTAIEEQRRTPKPGTVISHMLFNVEAAGRRCPTDQEIEGAVMLILGGGADTTVATTGTALYYLSEHPEDRKRLIEQPDLWSSAVDEFLRYASPAQALARVAAQDCMIGAQAIKKGDQVLLPWAAANWDEGEFEQPDRVVLDRFPNRHLAFGVGSHRCVGSNLARLMFTAMMQEVLTRLPDYTVIREGVRKAPNASVVTAFTNLPVVFTPSA